MPLEIDTQNQNGNQAAAGRGAISAELVRRVAERVYQMLITELRSERERSRMAASSPWRGIRS